MTPPPDMVSDLLRGMRHPNPSVRLKAARGLAKLDTPLREAFAVLVNAVSDPERAVREASTLALGAYGPGALPALTGFLVHSDKYVRRNAVWAIGKIGPAARPALPALCQALRDDDARTAAGAAQALGNMAAAAAPAVPALVEAMRGTNVVLCRLAAKALSQVGPPALDALTANLRHHDPFVRAEAALALGWMGDPAREAMSELVQLVEAYRPKVPPRPAVPAPTGRSETMTPPAPPSSVPPSSQEAARLNGIQALGRIGAGAALGMLKEVASQEEEPYRAAAALAVRQIEAPESRER